ncbi:MAG: tRNA (adenosine(37)-N6)-threonylcarbamoyltransferase complex transferase subunit TsaD [Erysipelotrichaceae bacterium]|nr:tRNA (adenosine(37)-N6)-threonylcarbamoyltransferase complex transferase subunit TsaD [Erysipelotrichaceae bacterium]
MDKIILAIESSCDETSIAILKNDNELLANVISTQIAVHQKYGGVMPEIASRLHVENIGVVLKEALEQAKITMEEVSAIAVTSGPGLIGALHVGLQCAKTLALMYNKPLIPVHHLAGHIYANEYVSPLKFPCLAIIVSGGNTELVIMDKHLSFNIIGETRDDAIGEAFDKVARVVGLPYPGGVSIDRLSKEGKYTYKLPRPLNDHSYDYSYSGIKTAVINLVNNLKQKGQEVNVPDLAHSFQKTAVDLLLDKALPAIDEFNCVQVVLAGGVSANSYLREQIVERLKDKEVEVIIPPLWCTTDNAAMIAKVGSYLYDEKVFADLSLSANPCWKLEDYRKF